MHDLMRHRVIGFVVLICLSFVVLATVSASSSSVPEPILSAVSAADLASFGIDLQAPSASSQVAPDSAAATAVKSFPGSSVSQVVLASFSDNSRVPAIHRLAWVVTLVPGAGFRGPAGTAGAATNSAPSYIVVFLDASTGAFIEAISG